VILSSARITGPTDRPSWRLSIRGGPTRSNFFDRVPNHVGSSARARNGHGSCGKRSADSAFPTSSHSRYYGTHIDKPARRGTPQGNGRIVKSSVHETTGGLATGNPFAVAIGGGLGVVGGGYAGGIAGEMLGNYAFGTLEP
jgi:hypothetical protein